MNYDIIEKIAKKRGTSPEYVRNEIDKVINDMWQKGLLQHMFPDIPTAEQFITKFAFTLSNIIK